MESRLIQGSPEWLEMRRSYLTATDAGTIMLENPYCDPYTLWRRKMDLLPPVQETEAMREGRILEVEALELFNKLFMRELKPEVVFCEKHPIMMASLDGISDCKNLQVEIKCGARQFEKIKNDEIPKDIFWQIQHQLTCTGNGFSYLMAYRSPEQYVLKMIVRDDEAIDRLIVSEKEFFRRMKEFDPPPQKHKLIETNEMAQAVDKYRVAKDMLSKAVEFEQEAKNELMALANDQCIEGYGLKITHYMQKGLINYKSIPELEGIDLEIYRSPPQKRSKITE